MTRSRRFPASITPGLLFSLLLGVASSLPAQSPETPATFQGDVPCADCAGVRYHLDLWPDQVFHLRREWAGKDLRRDEIGRWRVDAARRVLLLEGGGEMPLQFESVEPRVLRVLDVAGKPIASTTPVELRSAGRIEPVAVTLFMGGEVTLEGDTPLFTECLTGRTYAIASGVGAERLRQEYRLHRPGLKGALYVSLEGTLQPAIATLPDGTTRALAVVERFVGAWPNQACERSRADASLANTYWRLVQLQGESVAVHEGRREPHVLLRQADGVATFSATVGCNSLSGRWQYGDGTIAFGQAVNSRMACPPPLDTLERRLQELLAAAVRWQRTGNTLQLQDRQGATLALLEAVYF